MADKNTMIEQMLEHLVNDEKEKAEELFHEYVVSKSREIYETLIESEIKEEDKDEEDKDEEVEENFEEVAVEADNEMDLDTEDPTDDLASELSDEEGEEELDDKSEEELFKDLDAIVDELQAKFDELKGHEEAEGEIDTGDEDSEKEMKDDFDLETVREYVEKVPAPKGGDNGANTKSPVAGKNDMGGVAVKEFGGDEKGRSAPKAQDIKSGNVNVPGGNAADSLKKESSGHGAEKKSAAEQADNTASLFRGRR